MGFNRLNTLIFVILLSYQSYGRVGIQLSSPPSQAEISRSIKFSTSSNEGYGQFNIRIVYAMGIIIFINYIPTSVRIYQVFLQFRLLLINRILTPMKNNFIRDLQLKHFNFIWRDILRRQFFFYPLDFLGIKRRRFSHLLSRMFKI